MPADLDIKDFDANPNLNTTVHAINIDEGALTAQMNNSQRAILAVVARDDHGAGPVKVNVVDESTLDAGVTVDGLLIKDGDIPAIPATIAAAIDGVVAVPVGAVLPTAAAAAPTGFLLCDGADVSRATYADLFATIGIVYGAGDGSTTFGLPDLRGRSPFGVGTGDYADATVRALGEAGGLEAVGLTEANNGAHTHGIGRRNTGGSSAQMAFGAASGATSTSTSSGSGTPHENMPPYLILNFIIKT